MSSAEMVKIRRGTFGVGKRGFCCFIKSSQGRPLRRGHLHRPEGSKESSHVHVLGKSLSGKDEQRSLCCQAGVSKKQNGRA